MLRATAPFLALLAIAGAAAAEDAPQDAVQVRGKSLTLSCPEWKRNPDATWTSTGPLLVGGDTVNSVTLRGKDARVVEAKCLNASPSSAAPPAHGDPTKHRHRHGSAAPAGT